VTSDDDPAAVGSSYLSRPEIATALHGQIASGTRYSQTLSLELLYVAVPVLNGDKVLGAVRLTYPAQVVTDASTTKLGGLAIVALTTVLLAGAIGWILSLSVTRPLRRLTELTERFAEGDLSVRAEETAGAPELRSLSRSFNAMAERLTMALDQQRRFAADASHQLRTPLAGLRLRLEEARAASDDPEVHEEIDAGMAELDRLAAIISELLLLSQAGEVDAPPERLDLDDAARRAVARWDGTDGASVRGVEAAPEAPAFAPPADLDRVLDALIENALRYGGGEITVVSRPGGVEVLDRGPGLDGAELEAVFERFHRGRAGRSGPAGTGLGLAIARELARRWGGDVELANRPEGGAAARITVPAPPRERFPVS